MVVWQCLDFKNPLFVGAVSAKAIYKYMYIATNESSILMQSPK